MNDTLETFIENTSDSGYILYPLENLKDATQFIKPLIDKKRVVLFHGNTPKLLLDIARIPKEKLISHKNSLSSPESLVGITEAVLGIAETGTIVLFAMSTEEQLASLAPSTLIIVLPENKIVAKLDDALKKINPEDSPYILFLSGPSVTADIEKEIVHGVHGPKNLIILLVRGL